MSEPTEDDLLFESVKNAIREGLAPEDTVEQIALAVHAAVTKWAVHNDAVEVPKDRVHAALRDPALEMLPEGPAKELLEWLAARMSYAGGDRGE